MPQPPQRDLPRPGREVQTPSDTTFRIYDWGRTGRELHIKESLECIDFAPAPPATSAPANSPSGVLVTTPFFRIEHIRITDAEEHAVGLRGGGVVLIMLGGKGTLCTEGDRPFDPVTLGIGQTALLPAACAEGALLSSPSAGRCEFLMVTLP